MNARISEMGMQSRCNTPHLNSWLLPFPNLDIPEVIQRILLADAGETISGFLPGIPGTGTINLPLPSRLFRL
jgi:hypothetical protein